MRKFLLYSTILVAFTMSGGAANAACIQTPTCSSLGYTSSSSCDGGIKCPFGNAWNCTIINKITEVTNKITEIINKITIIEEKITEIEENDGNDNGNDGGTTTPDYTNCTVGAILYWDKSCDSSLVVSKKPIGVVFDRANRLAIALDTIERTWSDEDFDVPTLSNYSSSSAALADWQGKNNTRLVLEYCKTNGKSCPAFEYVNSYETDGTKAGDWYLPAFGELNAIYGNMGILNTALGVAGGTKLGTDNHWSSSEGSYKGAWNLFFSRGNMSTGSKYLDFYVRPVLAF